MENNKAEEGDRELGLGEIILNPGVRIYEILSMRVEIE